MKQPNDKLSDMCKKCDQIFDQFQGKMIKLVTDPLGKLQNLSLKKHPTSPPRIVCLFCKVKFFSRLRQLNVKLKLKTLNKSVRSFKQSAQFLN